MISGRVSLRNTVGKHIPGNPDVIVQNMAPGVSADRVKLIREAYDRTLKSPELVVEIEKRRWELNPIGGAELEELAKEVTVQPPDVIERMKWVLGR
ncbi:MAG: hypothetical protein ACREQW_12775 [Candidatus Binatia bacterium]